MINRNGGAEREYRRAGAATTASINHIPTLISLIAMVVLKESIEGPALRQPDFAQCRELCCQLSAAVRVTVRIAICPFQKV